MTFLRTLSDIRSDIIRTSQLLGIPLGLFGSVFIFFMPSIMALMLYRWSHWLYCKRLRFLAWPIWIFSCYLTGADIQPSTVIGRACYIGHPVGCALGGQIGDNAILFGAAVTGGGRGHGDVGAGDGMPLIGNNVVMGHGAKVLGPIVVGDNVSIGAMSLVLKSVPAGRVVAGIPARIIKMRAESLDFEAIARERR